MLTQDEAGVKAGTAGLIGEPVACHVWLGNAGASRQPSR